MKPEDSHARVRESFSAYLDGELGAPEKLGIDQHLATCIQCRTHLEALRRALGALGGLKKKAPPSFLPDIQQQIFKRSRGRFFGRRWLLFGRIPFEWVSLVMIIAMLIYYITTQQSAPAGVIPAP